MVHSYKVSIFVGFIKIKASNKIGWKINFSCIESMTFVKEVPLDFPNYLGTLGACSQAAEAEIFALVASRLVASNLIKLSF